MRILPRLPSGKTIEKIVFPVRFDRSQFTRAVTKVDPDVIIGLGQCSSGTKLRIEKSAANARRNRRTDPARPISAAGAKTLRTTLKLNLGDAARDSRSAGDYVCNFSMYVILDTLKAHGRRIPFAFVHVPYTYDEHRLVRLLTRAIKKLRTERPRRAT